jgi:GGDEF domain-containing protein
MKSLQQTIIALLVNLALFYAIERLAFQLHTPLAATLFVFLLHIVLIIAIISIPRLRNAPLYALFLLGGSIYLLGRLALSGTSLFNGILVYVFSTEIIFLSFSIFLAHTLIRSLQDFQEAVENITFADVRKSLHTQGEAEETIAREMLRSRRHQHALSVVVIKPNPDSVRAALHRSVRDVQHAMMKRYLALGLARLITNQMRAIDLLIEPHDQETFVILCPETNRDGATALLERIRKEATEQLGLTISTGVAAFPDEALTFKALFHKASQHVQTTAITDVSRAFDFEGIESSTDPNQDDSSHHTAYSNTS